MHLKLKVIGTSPCWLSRENEIWNAALAADPNFSIGNVHLLTVDGKNYSFDIKEARIPKDKICLMGWLSSDETMGRIAFEIQ